MARGSSLVELLVAMGLAGLVMAGTLSLFLAGQGAYAAGLARGVRSRHCRHGSAPLVRPWLPAG